MIRSLLPITMLFLLGASCVRAGCVFPADLDDDGDPPTVTLAATERANAFSVTVQASKPFCLVLLEVVAQGGKVPFATLYGGPTETPGASAKSAAGAARFSFLVNSWIPAGTTRYELWFPSGPAYVALDGQNVLWRRGSAALPVRITNGTWGVLALPVRKRTIKRRRS